MAKLDPTDKHTFRVLWSDEDEEFVGLGAERPSLRWLAASREGALKGVVKGARQAVEDTATSSSRPQKRACR